MTSEQTLKLIKFNTNAETTRANSARAIATLNSLISEAIEHQAYARTNPDSTVDIDMMSRISLGFEVLIPQFAEISNKINDLIAVKAGTMTVQELITKYNTDLVIYSDNLLK